MILESARVENFKCIDDSTEFSIRSLTALVGKNESGKTALLKALYRINPILPVDGSFLDTEYPRRRWAAYRQRKASAPDRVVTATWRLEETDLALVNDLLGPDALPGYTVAVTRGYDNRLAWHIDIDERRVVSNLMRRAKLDSDELRGLWSATNVAELVQTLRALEAPSPAQTALRLDVEERLSGGPLAEQVAAMLEKRLPRFLYFAEYHRLPGEVSIDELMRRKAANELTVVDTIFLALLELANTTPEDLQDIDQFEYLVAELEAVSQRITRDVMEYWSQDRSLEVDFRCDAARPHDPPPFNTGYVMRTRIRNRRHRTTLGFDERSAGFIWFFSFLVWLSHIRRDHGAEYVILLDEPGLGLHARAQMDMMRFIREKLLPAHQVIYTTHSPFMIDGQHLDGLRTVEDSSDGDTVLGTKVGDRVLSTDPDTLFPIRAALAYDVAKRVVTGPQTLLVDRPSDVLYLKWFSRELQLQGRAHLAPAWSLVPVGGLDSIAPFVVALRRPGAADCRADGRSHEPPPPARRAAGARHAAVRPDPPPGAVHRTRGRAARRPPRPEPLPRTRDGRLRPRGVGGARRGARLRPPAPRGRGRGVLRVDAAVGAALRQLRPGGLPVREHGHAARDAPRTRAGPRPVREALPRPAQPLGAVTQESRQ